MELTTLIDRDEAIDQLEHYQRQVESERTNEDDAIRRALRAAARGLPIISLRSAVTAGGFFPNGLPRIAICRADATQCHLRTGWDPGRFIYADRPNRQGYVMVGRHRVVVDVEPPAVTTNRRHYASTIVPSIPPQFRPKRNRLHLFHILWEVERWDPTPPADPALLRHLRGDLWSVQAVWDLTPLEQAVLAARADT
jgi:hypothetical protein